jgi:hypothetical protein
MFRGLSKEVVPVLYDITNLRKDGKGFFILDSSEYTMFPIE